MNEYLTRPPAEDFSWEEPADYRAFTELTAKSDIAVAFVHTEGCSVCHADQPIVERILQRHPEVVPIIVAPENQPEITGQLLLFTAPMVLVFIQGKEVHRQGRFIKMVDLENQLLKWTAFFDSVQEPESGDS